MIAHIPHPIIRAAAVMYAAGYRANDRERILADIPGARAHLMDYCYLLALHEDMERIR